ncbi:hypothetical protein [Dongia sp.]|uniref:hypothetical protein n=1 Tax=Dongia sp. TaxID=1977262 RepID=UPI0035B31FF3
MDLDRALTPATGLRLSDAMAAWWARIRPTEAEALIWWEAEIQSTAAAAMAAGATDTLRAATEALGAFRRADDVERRLYAQRAALAQYSHATAAFVAVLAAGALTARVLHDGRECALPPSFWLDAEFQHACWHRPAIYLDRVEFAAWLSAAAELERVPYSALVQFLAGRTPADTAAPSESEDWKAAKARFGARVSRQLIRGARKEIYADRPPMRGRPPKSTA